MDRAVILIGVSRTGSLPELQAVGAGLRRMKDWAVSQRIPDERISILSDEDGEVRAYQIGDEIERLVDLATIEQLIVYFSGHGVNNRGEYWLLSRAPANANEAVNVEASVLLARYCGISHVVMISDACRSAAEGIQAQHVMGSDIFPNDPAGGLENPVDIFFACARGNPALEIRDPNEAANEFSALYTEVLAECLMGRHALAVDYVEEDGRKLGLVRPRRLRDCLRDEVWKRLAAKLGHSPRINQTPDARIVSENMWLSRVTPTRSASRGGSRAFSESVHADLRAENAENNAFSLAGALMSSVLDGRLDVWRHQLSMQLDDADETSTLVGAVARNAAAFGPTQFETCCGIKLRGARVAQVLCRQANTELLDSDGCIVRVAGAPRSGASVLLVLTDGCGVLIPAIPEFIAELTFEGGLLADLSYEPSANTGRGVEYARRREEMRALRATVAASVGMGVFRLETEDALKFATKMQYSAGVDPSMALYAAYVYHDLQRSDLIRMMRSLLDGDLGFSFYDIVLLAGGTADTDSPPPRAIPAFPMLSRGWTMLSAFRVRQPPALRELERHLLPAPWTSFDSAGIAKLTRLLEAGDFL